MSNFFFHCYLEQKKLYLQIAGASEEAFPLSQRLQQIILERRTKRGETLKKNIREN